MKGCDYSFARPPIPALKAAGIQFVMRYITGKDKAITAAEFKSLRAHGFQVGFVFEGGVGDYEGGFARGKANATVAREAITRLGVPGAAIYFAVDTDIYKASQMAQVADYFRGIMAVIPKMRVGVYGDDEAFKSSHAHYYWRARGWRHPTSPILPTIDQYYNGASIGGAAVDLDRTLVKDAGLVGAPRPVPVPPKPVPVPKPKPVPAPPPPHVVLPEVSPNQPSPLPAWWWAWADWRRGGKVGPRPQTPRLIKPWAWIALVRYNLKHPIKK